MSQNVRTGIKGGEGLQVAKSVVVAFVESAFRGLA